ncbi:MAG: glycoside hydrolase [Candidatus Latescibacteria bacterium]|nr:glycoside hydrolase [Candidatus Latescibacterota bacterium]
MEPKTGTRRPITFQLSAPEARAVFLAGSFNDWEATSLPMAQDERGVWKAEVDLEAGVYEYRFMVDGEWQDDPECEERCANGFGTCNCVVRI